MIESYLMYKNKLQDEYKEAFDKAELYCNVRGIDVDNTEDLLGNLIDMLLQAQEDGRPANKIVGDDIEVFCKSYFKNYGIREMFRTIPKKLRWICGIVLVYSSLLMIVNISEGGFDFWSWESETGGFVVGYISTIIFLILLDSIVRVLMFRSKKLKMSVYYLLFGILILVLLFVLPQIYTGEVNIRFAYVMIVSGSYLLIDRIVTYIRRYTRTGHIFRDKDKITGKGRIKQQAYSQLPVELEKRMTRINNKRIKKGQALLTYDDFATKLEKENSTIRWIVIGTYVIIIGLCIAAIVFELINSSIQDALIFGCVLLVCEIPAMLICRLLSFSYKIRINYMKECRINNTRYFEISE